AVLLDGEEPVASVGDYAGEDRLFRAGQGGGNCAAGEIVPEDDTEFARCARRRRRGGETVVCASGGTGEEGTAEGRTDYSAAGPEFVVAEFRDVDSAGAGGAFLD